MMKKISSAMLCVLLCVCMTAAAVAESLVPGGSALGIRMRTDGVLVSDTRDVETPSGKVSPAREAGIKRGDVIVRVGETAIGTAEDLKNAVRSLSGEKIKVTLMRGDDEKTVTLTPAKDRSGAWRLGLLLRDEVCGVGTLTFYDPETGVYGALGHSISLDGGDPVPIGGGEIRSARITGIVPGKAGAPGQLDGESDGVSYLGDIRVNCANGIFGRADIDGATLETGEMKKGAAKLRCTLSDNTMHDYTVEIKKIFSSSAGTAAVVTVTDPELIARTGGIVQGMSGSPIIQNGCLVGAVTHVFVNDPTSGYAISIQDMLTQARKCA